MGFVIIYLCKAKMVCIARLPFFFPEAEMRCADSQHGEFDCWFKRSAQRSVQGWIALGLFLAFVSKIFLYLHVKTCVTISYQGFCSDKSFLNSFASLNAFSHSLSV